MAESSSDRRRSERVPVRIPVVLKGTDSTGRDFFDRTEVVSADGHGARMRTRFALKVGSDVEVQLPPEKTSRRLRVVWRGEAGTLYEGMIGVELLDPNDSWNIETLKAQWGSRGF